MVAEVLNWNDIKTTEIVSNPVVTESTRTPRKYESHTNGDVSADINHACCAKIAVVFGKQYGSDMSFNKENSVTHQFTGGSLNGKSIVIKSRRNVYNAGGNFTFNNDDMMADLVAIYTYSGETHTGMCYIAEMKNVRNLTMRKVNDYWLCPEDAIIAHAFKSFNLKFN